MEYLVDDLGDQLRPGIRLLCRMRLGGLVLGDGDPCMVEEELDEGVDM